MSPCWINTSYYQTRQQRIRGKMGVCFSRPLLTFQKFHMYMEYIQRMWTRNGICHILSHFKPGPSEGRHSVSFEGLGGWVQMAMFVMFSWHLQVREIKAFWYLVRSQGGYLSGQRSLGSVTLKDTAFLLSDAAPSQQLLTKEPVKKSAVFEHT